jgi:hypothetical protein
MYRRERSSGDKRRIRSARCRLRWFDGFTLLLPATSVRPMQIRGAGLIELLFERAVDFSTLSFNAVSVVSPDVAPECYNCQDPFLAASMAQALRITTSGRLGRCFFGLFDLALCCTAWAKLQPKPSPIDHLAIFFRKWD